MTHCLSCFTFYAAEQLLYISSYLYGDKSDVTRAVIGSDDDIILNTDTSDHIKFLAEISFQLSNSTILSHALQLPQSVLDRIKHECQHIGHLCFSSYKLLVEWVIRNGRDARLSNLKSALYKMGFKICGSSLEDSDVLVRPCFDKHPFPNICSSKVVSAVSGEVKFVFNLSRMLSCCWRSVGSLMGIPLVRLNEIDIAASSDISFTPEYTMLLEWQRRNGRDATLGTMFKAIKCVFDYSPSYVNHAYWYATQFAECMEHSAMT